MQKENSSAGRELVRTVISEHLSEVVFDVAEAALDANLADGVIKDLPIIGPVVKFVQAGKSISGALFILKLMRFLKELQNVPWEEREKLLKKYPDSSERQKVLGENLLLALERLDDIEKPRFLARFFAAYIKTEIDYTTFTRLSRALERFNLALLQNLRWFYTREGPKIETPEEIIHELSLAGLVTVSLEDSGTYGGGADYRYSTIGEEFLRVGFNVQNKKR